MVGLTRDAALELDARSPIADRRGLFDLPAGAIYLCGNSLGALPQAVTMRMAQVLVEEWGRDLITSWNAADWTHLGDRIAARIAPLIGAEAGDVFVGDSTSVTLFKTMVAAARLRPGRRTLVVEPTTFPTDGYIASGVARLLDLDLRWCDPEDPVGALDDTVALLSLTHVNFRTGAMYDMRAITDAAHEAGALIQWDLCHSAGAVPVDLRDVDADFAVGCTYKYLNGGPGSPAFGYAAPRHQGLLAQPITGWWGHAEPFAFGLDYVPAPGVTQMTVGTPPVLALSALEAALTAFEGVAMKDLRAASLSLTDTFIAQLDARVPGLDVVTPRDHARRGSQVAFQHPQAYGIVQALIERGVIGDFRDPDVARFGFAPLYVSHVDAFDAVEQLVAVLEGDEHLSPEYAERNTVT
jgi:kynureninase